MKITEIAREIKKCKNVLIFSHNRPDGDTVGSATALKLALEKLNIRADIICSYDIPDKFSYIETANCYVKSAEQSEYDAFISVDCSTDHMFPDLFGFFVNFPVTFNIDHHVSNTRYAKFNYVEDTSACCEIIYKLIVELGVEIDKEIATALLTGIITDTGAYQHSNVTPETFEISAKLRRFGADNNEIIRRNFKDQPQERAKLFAKVISGMRYRLDGKVAIIVVTKQDFIDCNAQEFMTEGFIDHPLSVRGVEVALSLMEVGKNRYKISLRSKGKVNVNEIASLYGGGGHILASGALLNGYLEDIIDKLCYNVEQRL